MQTRHCPLCGLETPDTDDHATRTHNMPLDAAEELLSEGRRALADKLEREAAREHRNRIPRLDEEPERNPRAIIDGGYL